MRAQEAKPAAAQSDDIHFFNEKVRPVLAENCYKCHTGETMGGLRLDSRTTILKGGDSGPAMTPGDPDKSLIIEAVKQTGDLKMPPKGKKLTDSEIAILIDWVKTRRHLGRGRSRQARSRAAHSSRDQGWCR